MSEQLAFTISETISISGLGRTSIFAAIRSGELKARKFRRRTLVLKADLEEFIGSLPDARSNAG